MGEFLSSRKDIPCSRKAILPKVVRLSGKKVCMGWSGHRSLRHHDIEGIECSTTVPGFTASG
eukprot:6483435-Amphidinium_carterae.1